MPARTVDSPVGLLLLTASAEALTGVWFAVGSADDSDGNAPVLEAAATQLEEYFGGSRLEFDLLLDAAGTPFQRRVWAAVCDIPYGETSTYADVAARIGLPAAIRAVGAANARNPLSIVVPCHRVVGADGSLTGYGGGLAAKRWLLDHERHVRDGRVRTL